VGARAQRAAPPRECIAIAARSPSPRRGPHPDRCHSRRHPRGHPPAPPPRALQDIGSVYNLGKVLGRGQFGTTRLAELKKDNKTYACKSIAKRKLTLPEDREDVKREVQIMHHLKGHPNVTYLRDTFEDKQSVHLVMDLCAGGELFDAIQRRGMYSEAAAASLMRTIVEVVAHCHNMGVIHRDLKPENFLMESLQDDARCLCTDFGLSVFFNPGQQFTEVVGSAFYVAPEVLKRRYGPEADIWSCGVILYILLSGVPPFWGETEQQIFDSILKGKLDFESAPWPSISDEAKDCVRQMLTMDAKKRASADTILQHPWMKENGVASDKPLGDAIYARLSNFAGMHRLKKQAMKIIASSMPADEIAGLKAIFLSIDVDQSGTITASELNEALKKKGASLKPEDVESLLTLIDSDANGTIDYEEFLAATLSQHQMEQEENLRAAFAHFDTNGDGIISREELFAGLAVSRVRSATPCCPCAGLSARSLAPSPLTPRPPRRRPPPRTSPRRRSRRLWTRWTRTAMAKSTTRSSAPCWYRPRASRRPPCGRPPPRRAVSCRRTRRRRARATRSERAALERHSCAPQLRAC
jgi:calcium-dependent protein kinase